MTHESPDRDGAYQFDLWCQLETTVDQYEQARDVYWSSRFEIEDWSDVKQLRAEADEIAALIRRRALSLLNLGNPSDVNGIYRVYHEEMDRRRACYEQAEEKWLSRFPDTKAAEIRNALRRGLKPDPEFQAADEPLRLVWEALCVADAWHVVTSIRERVKRLLDLERLIYEECGRVAPSAMSVQFLSLVSRTYTFGFDTECVAMCRSAMEQAFRESASDDHFHRAGREPTDNASLACLINVAVHVRNQLLSGSSELHRDAECVRLRGGKAIHDDLQATGIALDTIRRALRVINALAQVSECA